MKLKIYHVDAFTDKVFGGNPAGVVILDGWIEDRIMQNIAFENNLSETAFIVKNGDRYEIRWFAPKAEVDLCGHATLASGFVLATFYNAGSRISLYSPRSGELTVTNKDGYYTLIFPRDEIKEVELTEEMINCFNYKPKKSYRGRTDLMFIFEREEEIAGIMPVVINMNKFSVRGMIVTARGRESDFVSRFFAPTLGIEEDPVTGSAHTTLTPYWSAELGKEELTAIQLSERRGYLRCVLKGEKVEIEGQARLYLTGEIEV